MQQRYLHINNTVKKIKTSKENKTKNNVEDTKKREKEKQFSAELEMPTECERTTRANVSQTVQQIQQHTHEQQQQQQSTADQQLQRGEGEVVEAAAAAADQLEFNDDMEAKELNGGKMSTSQTSTSSSSSTNGHNGNNNNNNNTNGVGKKTSIISPDPTPYVTKARVTRPTPPPPPYNPMQFVQIKPCNLYQTAQEQLKKAEEVKKIKEIKKEDPEDWQNNLDNWKSSRRKRVEHIIDRVVEVKKLELEEHDRTRRKSKTFSEMIEERGERGVRGRAKLATLAVYNEDESNDLSDLGIGTSSASGKSSQSEDYDNNSVLSDNPELDKAINENNQKPSSIPPREYISSPGYDTSSSTAPGSSPDPCEYTYEGAIQDYKQRVSRASGGNVLTNYKLNNANTTNAGLLSKSNTSINAKEMTRTECNNTNTNNATNDTYPTRRGSKIEDRLIGFEVTSPSDSQQEGLEKKVDVPKIDISKRKEIFENHNNHNTEPKSMGGLNVNGNIAVPRVTLRDRFKLDESAAGNVEVRDSTLKREVKRLSGDITSVRSRMQSLEQQQNLVNSLNSGSGGGGRGGSSLGAGGRSTNAKIVDIPVPPLKERLSSLQNAVTKDDMVKKAPVALVDARQLEIMKNEEDQRVKQIEIEKMKQKELEQQEGGQSGNKKEMNGVKNVNQNETTLTTTTAPLIAQELMVKIDAPEEEIDRDDSGIHTADDGEIHITTGTDISEQEQQLNAAIAALALEEQQLTEAANTVNQIEAEFDELSTNAVNAIASDLAAAAAAAKTTTTATNEQPCEMEFSVSSTNKLSLLEPFSCVSSIKSSSVEQQQQQQNNDNNVDNNDADNDGRVCISSSCGRSDGAQVANNIDREQTKLNNHNTVNIIKDQSKVLGNTLNLTSSQLNLKRKPSNEMVHARNLLRMFQDTFKSDIELDEEQEQAEVKAIVEPPTSNTINSSGVIPKLRSTNINEPIQPQSPLSPQPQLNNNNRFTSQDIPINTQIFQPSNMSPQYLPPTSALPSLHTQIATPIVTPQTPQTSTTSRAPTPPLRSSPSALLSNGIGSSMIPRAVNNPIGKPPMSPKSMRYNLMSSPVNSPPPVRKSTTDYNHNNSQFSINGRVEIFNSKNININSNSMGKPPTPTLNTRKSYVPHLVGTQTTIPTSPILGRSPSPMSAQANSVGIGFPKQQQLQQHHHLATVTALTGITEALPTSNQTILQTTAANTEKVTVAMATKPMPSAQAVTEPSYETRQRALNVTIEPHTPQQPQQKQQNEVVMCAPPVTILNPDELPKPNTVKMLSNCFSQDAASSQMHTKMTLPPLPGPKPLPRSRIPQQTPPQSPTPARRNFSQSPTTANTMVISEEFVKSTRNNELGQKSLNTEAATLSTTTDMTSNANDLKKLSIISNSSTLSSESSTNTGPFEITAQIHTPPLVSEDSKELNRSNLKPVVLTRNAPVSANKPFIPTVRPTGDPLKANDVLAPIITVPSKMPELVACKPNASTLFKLATPPASPNLPRSPQSPLSPTDVTLCSSFLNSFEPTNSFLPTNQKVVHESACKKVDVADLPPDKCPPCTFYSDISHTKLSECDESGKQNIQNVLKSTPPQVERQQTVEEKICQKIDINDLPAYDQVPLTGYDEVTADQVRRCDGLAAEPTSNANNVSTLTVEESKHPTTTISSPTTSTPSITNPSSKPNSPIMTARAAHSRALIDTCERIIAEERMHSTQIKSALPPTNGPKNAGGGTPILQRKSKIPKPIPCCIGGSDSMNQADQIGKPVLKQQTSTTSVPESVDENMVIGRLHVVETQIKVTTTTPPPTPTAIPKSKVNTSNQNTKKTKNIFDFLRKNFGLGDDGGASADAQIAVVDVASAPMTGEKDTTKVDEIITVDNSKFYVTSDDIKPPPLPKTPAPVNIKITKTFTTNEIVEEGTSEQALVEEINEMLDDELNKLTLESGSSVSGGK